MTKQSNRPKLENETEIFLIRHAITDWNKQGYFQGISDISLNAEGHEQAQVLKHRFINDGVHLDHIYTSFLLRTQETAAPLAAAYELEPEVLEGVHEIHVGDFEGMHIDDIAAKYPKSMLEKYKQPYLLEMPNGETGKEVYERGVKAIESVIAKHQGESVAIVTHGLFLQLIYAYIQGDNPEDAKALISPNTSVSRILISPTGEIEVVYLNNASHML